MAISRQKKEAIVRDLHAKTEKSDIVVFVNFHGLNVKDMSVLRSALRKVGASITVAKKRLIKRVLDGFGFSGEMPPLDGEIAFLSQAGDIIAPLKIIDDFTKKHEGLRILGGVFDKRFISFGAVKTLASMPPREVLLGHMAGVIASPLLGFLRVVNGPVQNFIRVLNNIAKSR